ncbi:MAG TPA: hypothetical protein VML19_22480 [Verrucomicrobiae bacterium]|nr:hypothetical protein [Verrucomicrobiae bacterium]
MHLDFGAVFTGGVGAILLSAAARALPEPQAGGSAFYLWVYRTAHLLLANFDKARLGNDGQPGGN